MLETGDSVIIALSGGPDSVALLYLINNLSLKYKLKLYIAHLNHGLRGKEAERDEKFCKNLAKKLKIPFFSNKIYIKKIKDQEKGRSIEELARRERYKFLLGVAKKVNASKIVLGHTADDQVETVTMRFIRGAGTKGLSGIPPKRKLSSGVWIIRPLFCIWKDEIIQFLKKKKISFKKDSTNKKIDFLRNRIRHELIPILTKYNSGIKNVIQSTGNNMALIDNYLEDVIEKKFKSVANINQSKISIACNKLNRFHPAISQLLISRIVKEIDKDVSLESDNIRKILLLVSSTDGSKTIHLPKRIWVRREYNNLIFSKLKKQTIKKYTKELVIKGNTKVPSCNILITSKLRRNNGSLSYAENANVSNFSNIFRKKGLSFEAKIDYDTLTQPIILRGRRKGDLFRPTGMKGKKKVKDIFIDKKIPQIYRDKVPILVSGNEICWVVGYRIGEKFKIKPNTKRILHIRATFTV